jgi:hypothetical protein
VQLLKTAAAIVVHQLLGGGKIMAVAFVLQTPVRITGVVAVHDDNGILFILRYDPDNGVPMQVKAFPKIPGQILRYHLLHDLE